jgi:hypothetical protein
MMSKELTLHNYWDASSSEERTEIVERAFKIIEKQNEYIDLLGAELTELSQMAHVRGWKSTRVEDGNILRGEIKELEKPSNDE